MSVDTQHVRDWMTAFVQAWQDKDGPAAAALFTTDGVFQAIPGVAKQTFRGAAEIRAYWEDITASQSEVTVLLGEPLIQGDRAAVEMWVTLRNPRANPDGDHWATLVETNIMDFDADGLCVRMAEYWNLRRGRIDPPAGWGRPV